MGISTQFAPFAERQTVISERSAVQKWVLLKERPERAPASTSNKSFLSHDRYASFPPRGSQSVFEHLGANLPDAAVLTESV